MTDCYYGDTRYERPRHTESRKKPVITAPTAENPRNLTVCHSRNAGQYSALTLQGKWLEASGFNPGDKVSVACVDGKLIIEKTMDAAEAYKN